jgi:hypothetical protein
MEGFLVRGGPAAGTLLCCSAVPPTTPEPRDWQAEANLLARGRDLVESLCGSTRYRQFYPEGPNLALLLEVYQQLDRLRAIGRVPRSARGQRRAFKRLLRGAVRRDVLDRNRRLTYGYPTPRVIPVHTMPDVVAHALSQLDPDQRAFVEAIIGGGVEASAGNAPGQRSALQAFRDALLGETLARPASIPALHPQYMVFVRSAQPTRRRHPIVNLLLVKLPLQLLLVLVTLFNVAYIGAYFFFNDEVLGRFISSRVSSIIDGDLEMGSIHWEGRLIFDLITGNPTPAVVRDVTVWEPYKSLGHERRRKTAHADRVDATLVLHEIIPWNRIGVPAFLEIPWVLHFEKVRIYDGISVEVRGYEDMDADGNPVELVGLIRAFQLYDFEPPEDTRGLSFLVEDAITYDTTVDLNFEETAGWRTAVTLERAQWHLRFDAPMPVEGKPVDLPLRFAIEGTGGRGMLKIDDIEVPIEDGDLRRFTSGEDGAPLSDIEFEGSAVAGGSRVVAYGTLGRALTRSLQDEEPLPADADADYGALATVVLDAATQDAGPIVDHVERELGLHESALSAHGSPATARVEGPLSNPTYHLAVEGMRLDVLDQPAWAADDVYLSLTMAQGEIPERWRDRFPPETARRVVTFHTLRGSVLGGSFKQARSRPTALGVTEPAHIVMPATPDEPYLMAGDFDLAGVDPAGLAPDDPDLARTLAGAARGAVDVHKLVVGPPTLEVPSDPAVSESETGGESDAEAADETALHYAELHLGDVRLVRNRGPRDDGVPKTLRADGRVAFHEDGSIDVGDLLVSTDGARLRIDGGIEGDMQALRTTQLDLRVDDGPAFARAIDLPPYFERLRADMALFGPIRAPSSHKGHLHVSGVGGSTLPTDASVWMKDGVFHLRAPQAHLFGGRGRVELEVALFDRGGLSSDPRVRAHLELEGVEIAQLVPGGPRGTIDLELVIDDGEGGRARLSQLRAHGLATARELELAGTTYRDVGLAFRLDPEALAIDRLVLSVHHPVSPRLAPEVTVPIGDLVATGTVSLDPDPALDLAVEANGIPLHVVADLLEIELPLRGKIASGTSLRVGGRLSRPSVEGRVALAGVAVEGIALGRGELEFTSEDFDAEGPLAPHRELRARGELATLGPEKIQWTVDSVVAIGHARAGETPPVSAQLDVGFDQLSIPMLLRDPLDAEALAGIDGALQGIDARLLTCNPGAPMLSDCVEASRSATEQTLAMALSIDRAWVRGKDGSRPSDPCSSPTTLCSRGRLLAKIDWPMIALEHPWRLATGGAAPAELEIRGAFDLSEPPSRSPDTAEAEVSCRPPAFDALAASAHGDAGGRGDAEVIGTVDFGAVAPLLAAYGIDSASGRLDVELALRGHLFDPTLRGSASLRKTSDPLVVEVDTLPFPLELPDLGLRVGDGWLVAQGTLGLLGDTLRFGTVDGDRTGYALAGACAGHFAIAAQGALTHQLIANITGDPELTPGGGIDVPRFVVAGEVGETVRIDRLEGGLELADHTLQLNPTEGLSDVELVRGRVDFESCASGRCEGDAEPGSIAIYVGGRDAATSASRPPHALRARIDRRGVAWAWGRTIVSPDLQRLSHTQLAIRLDDVPYRHFDARGTLVFEAEVSSNDLAFGGGEPLVLHGTLDVDRARYVKDAIQGVEILRLTEEVDAPGAPPPELLRTMQFDVRVDTQRPIRVENNVAHGVEASLALGVGGTWMAPELSGRLDVEPGGEVNIPFVTGTYRIQRGRVTLVRDIEDAEVDVLAQREEPIYIEGQPRQIQLALGGTLSAIRWSCISQGADPSAALDTVRGCTEYLVLGAGDVQITESDVQRVGGAGLASARKPLQVVGHLTEFDIGKRAEEAAPRYRTYIPDARLRLGQIGPELEVSTPREWFDFDWGRATLGWDYVRGYPGFLLRQSRQTKFRLQVLDPVSLEFSRQTRDYLNERIIFDPLEQVTLELRFDFQIPSLR